MWYDTIKKTSDSSSLGVRVRTFEPCVVDHYFCIFGGTRNFRLVENVYDYFDALPGMYTLMSRHLIPISECF